MSEEVLTKVATHRIVDADTHVLEPPGIWQEWLPKRYLDKAPKLVKDEEGGDAWLFAGSSEADPIGLVATPGMPYDEFRWTGVTYDDARPGCYDGAERLKDMDTDGVDACLVFAPQRTIGHFLGDEDDEFVRAGVDAYNRFLAEQFCAPDRSRLVGLAQMPSTGIDDAVDFLRKAGAEGFKGVVLSNWPSGGDSISDDDDPFWAAAQETGLPVAIHINMISRRARQASRQLMESTATSSGTAGTKPGSKPRESDGAEDENDNRKIYGGKSAKANAKAVGGLAGVFSTVPSTVAQFIFTGVFERFSDLQVVMVETGVGWIAHFLEQMDDRYWRNRSWGNIPIAEAPSFY
jgi:predicted TIM-barrel fold metal-dependent hydrolase